MVISGQTPVTMFQHCSLQLFFKVILLPCVLCALNKTHLVTVQSLPPNWEQACVLADVLSPTDDVFYTFTWPQSVVRILCTLSNGNVLQWEDFRNWTNAEAAVPIALEITCPVHNEGAVHIPWPMKANNFIYLTVKNCGVYSYYAEFFTAHQLNIPDSLRVLEIADCVIHYEVADVRLLVNNIRDVSPDAHCGQLTLEKYVSRNLTYQLAMKNATDLSELSAILLSNGSDYYTDIQAVPTRCHFKHLRYMDESQKRSLGRKHFFLQQFKSSFPQMRFYNLSNIGLTAIPSELKHWRFNFPLLEYLDLSKNQITSFDFIDYNPFSENPGIIDLRFNNITKITKEELKTLKLLKSAFIDINNNTLSCECNDNAILFNHLENIQSVRYLWQRYDYLSKLPCSLADSRVVPFYHVSRTDIFCDDKNVERETPDTTTLIVTVTLLVIFVAMVVAMVGVVRHLKSRKSVPSKVIFLHTTASSPNIVRESLRKKPLENM